MQKRTVPHTGNGGLFIVGTFIYLAMIVLFAWQTWLFVDWLFPTDQILMKLLTLLCFDIMALFWACLDVFYKFATRVSRSIVRWAWGVTFILSLVASIFFLVIQSVFRFKLALSPDVVNIGYGVTITAVTLNILFLTFWWYCEWIARHPHTDLYLDDNEEVYSVYSAQKQIVQAHHIVPETPQVTVTQIENKPPVAVISEPNKPNKPARQRFYKSRYPVRPNSMVRIPATPPPQTTVVTPSGKKKRIPRSAVGGASTEMR